MMPSNDEIKTILVQLAKLETKIDHVLTIVPLVHTHDIRLTKVEVVSERCDDHDNRLDSIERKQSYFMGGVSLLGTLGAVVAWFSGIFHDLFR
jgi:tetrahydromethanopterin S-methyltransferase subunit G